MKAQITINHTCIKCNTITTVIFESGDAAEKLIHCGACGEWQTVRFQEATQDERPGKATRKPTR